MMCNIPTFFLILAAFISVFGTIVLLILKDDIDQNVSSSTRACILFQALKNIFTWPVSYFKDDNHEKIFKFLTIFLYFFSIVLTFYLFQEHHLRICQLSFIVFIVIFHFCFSLIFSFIDLIVIFRRVFR